MGGLIRFPPPRVVVGRFPNGFRKELENTLKWLLYAGLHPEVDSQRGGDEIVSVITVPADEEDAAKRALDPGNRYQHELGRFVRAHARPRRKGKTLRAFIKEHRREITDHIRAQGITGPLNDEDREGWVSNDEGLLAWARAEGVEGI